MNNVIIKKISTFLSIGQVAYFDNKEYQLKYIYTINDKTLQFLFINDKNQKFWIFYHSDYGYLVQESLIVGGISKIWQKLDNSNKTENWHIVGDLDYLFKTQIKGVDFISTFGIYETSIHYIDTNELANLDLAKSFNCAYLASLKNILYIQCNADKLNCIMFKKSNRDEVAKILRVKVESLPRTKIPKILKTFIFALIIMLMALLLIIIFAPAKQ